MKKLTSLLLALALMFSLGISAFAEDSLQFDPTVTITKNADGTITVTLNDSNENNTILAAKQPTLSVPCAFSNAYVLFQNRVIPSALKGGVISFTVSQGGTYTICAYTPVVPPVEPTRPSNPSTPSTPVNNVSDTVKVEATVSGGTATVKDIPASEISKAGTDAVSLDFSETGKTVNEVKLPTKTVETIAASSSEGLEIKLSTAAVSFDAAAVDAISDAATGKDISLNVETVDVKTLSAEQKSTIEGLGNAIIIQATLTSGGETISDFGGGSAAVTVPYEKKNTDKVVAVYYMDDAGKLTKMNASYDPATKSITFTAPHFSEYVLTEIDALPFTDVAESDWYCDSVRYVFEQGLMGGTSAATFAPSALTNRQQVWMILARLSGEKPADMAAARAWAIKAGVSDGSKPTAAITRQQLAAMLYRYAGSPAASGTLGFTDKASIADYAKDAVLWCVEKDIIGGYTDGSFRPAAKASRAHLAAMLQRYMEQVG